MGTIYKFVCPSCGYAAEVSGHGDGGFKALTVTIACKHCKELYDVAVSTCENSKAPEWIDVAPHCPNSPTHEWVEWRDPGACPRCATAMVRGEVVAWWD